VLLASSGRPASPGHPGAGKAVTGTASGRPSGAPAPGAPSAHAILLAAATSAARMMPAAQGAYWRVRTETMVLRPAGPKANPYNMAWLSLTDEANARAVKQPSRWMSQELGAKPATPQDAAAWRADGSPRGWVIIPVLRVKPDGTVEFTKTSSAPGAPLAFDQQMNGDVADAVGDGSWLTTAQLAAFPADPARLKALMVRYVNYDYRFVGGPAKGTMDQNLMVEAVNLLQAPLPPAVRSAVFQVMAGLSGSRTLGPMRDPLGRTGYGIAIADAQLVDEAWLPSGTQGEAVLIVDPASGQLLATEVIVTTPGSAVVPGQSARKHVAIKADRGKPAAGGSSPCQKQPAPASCVPPVYYGLRHQGQVWWYTVIKSAAWTHAAP
jgi:hypothetical protein